MLINHTAVTIMLTITDYRDVKHSRTGKNGVWIHRMTSACLISLNVEQQRQWATALSVSEKRVKDHEYNTNYKGN